jgi:hypothetical protein
VPTPIAKTLKARTADERMLISLGGALIMHWDTIPDAIQDILIDQAAIGLEDAGSPERQAELETLVRTAKLAPLASETRAD